jgi:hypothetical protein
MVSGDHREAVAAIVRDGRKNQRKITPAFAEIASEHLVVDLEFGAGEADGIGAELPHPSLPRAITPLIPPSSEVVTPQHPFRAIAQ